MRVANDSLIDTPADWSTQWYSQPILLQQTVNFSVQLFFSGTPVGMLKLQCSNDASNSSRDERTWTAQTSHWTDVECSEQIIATAGDHTWTVQNAGYMWVRVSWAPSGGTSQLDVARFTAKGF